MENKELVEELAEKIEEIVKQASLENKDDDKAAKKKIVDNIIKEVDRVVQDEN